MLCTEIVSDIQNNFCKQHVLPTKRRASDKDFPVVMSKMRKIEIPLRKSRLEMKEKFIAKPKTTNMKAYPQM